MFVEALVGLDFGLQLQTLGVDRLLLRLALTLPAALGGIQPGSLISDVQPFLLQSLFLDLQRLSAVPQLSGPAIQFRRTSMLRLDLRLLFVQTPGSTLEGQFAVIEFLLSFPQPQPSRSLLIVLLGAVRVERGFPPRQGTLPGCEVT